jgi:hypothetical protein
VLARPVPMLPGGSEPFSSEELAFCTATAAILASEPIRDHWGRANPDMDADLRLYGSREVFKRLWHSWLCC